MANDIKMTLNYLGHSMADNREELEVFVRIDRETMFEIKYLLGFAAEKHDNYCHVSDAVHLRDSLEECWRQANEDFENEIED